PLDEWFVETLTNYETVPASFVDVLPASLLNKPGYTAYLHFLIVMTDSPFWQAVYTSRHVSVICLALQILHYPIYSR
ncbi:MAG: hypothetical protein NTX06_08925, partial [Proteobacteria bacterium]|nr:hypothetical protein [Pseudomonadota bacterium]